MTCPVCSTEFSTPYIREAWRNNANVWCPQGHELRFLPAEPVERQVEALERMYQLETP